MKKPITNLGIVVIFILFFVITGLLASAAPDSDPIQNKPDFLAQFVTSTPNPNPPTEVPTDPPPVPTTSSPEVTITSTTVQILVELGDPKFACSVAPKNTGVNIRPSPSTAFDPIGALSYEWYEVIGISDETNPEVWYQIRFGENQVGWVADSVTQVGPEDCAQNFLPMANCAADIRQAAPNQLTSYVIGFFGDDCDLLDDMLNDDARTDDLQDRMPFTQRFGGCVFSLVDLIYLRLETIQLGAGAFEEALSRIGTEGSACSLGDEPDQPKMSFSVSDGLDFISPDGGTVTYTLTFNNDSKHHAYNVKITSQIPSNAICVTCTTEGGSIVSEIGTVKGGVTASVHVTVILPAASPQTDHIYTANLTYADKDGNEIETITKTDSTTVITPPTPITPTPTGGNNDQSPTNTPAPTVTVTLPNPTLVAPPTPTSIPLPTDSVGVLVVSSKDGAQSQLKLISKKDNAIITVSLSVFGKIAYPVFSPNGQTIAFLQDAGEGWTLRILIPNTQEERTLLRSSESGKTDGLSITEQQIAWMPDGKTILLTLRDSVGQSNIYWVDLDRNFGLFNTNASAPAVSPENPLRPSPPGELGEFLFAFQRDNDIFMVTGELTTKHLAFLKSNPNPPPEVFLDFNEDAVLKKQYEALQQGCDVFSEPVFNDSDEFPLYYVCEQAGADSLMLYKNNQPKEIVIQVGGKVISTFNQPAALPGWYLTFNDGESMYLVQLAPDTNEVIEVIDLELTSDSWNAVYANWRIDLTKLDG